MELLTKISLGVLIFLSFIIFVRVNKRGYFWKAKDGSQVKLKDFFKRWKGGVINITPLQQTLTTLWSFIPIFAGIIWGVSISVIVKTYWLSLILIGSLPITGIQFISNLQKYKAQKRAAQAMKEAGL